MIVYKRMIEFLKATNFRRALPRSSVRFFFATIVRFARVQHRAGHARNDRISVSLAKRQRKTISFLDAWFSVARASPPSSKIREQSTLLGFSCTKKFLRRLKSHTSFGYESKREPPRVLPSLFHEYPLPPLPPPPHVYTVRSICVLFAHFSPLPVRFRTTKP